MTRRGQRRIRGGEVGWGRPEWGAGPDPQGVAEKVMKHANRHHCKRASRIAHGRHAIAPATGERAWTLRARSKNHTLV